MISSVSVLRAFVTWRGIDVDLVMDPLRGGFCLSVAALAGVELMTGKSLGWPGEVEAKPCSTAM